MHNNVFSKALQNAGIGITNKKQYQICGRYYGINVWKSSGGEENSTYGFNAHGEETGLKINVAKTKLLKCSKDSDRSPPSLLYAEIIVSFLYKRSERKK